MLKTVLSSSLVFSFYHWETSCLTTISAFGPKFHFVCPSCSHTCLPSSIGFVLAFACYSLVHLFIVKDFWIILPFISLQPTYKFTFVLLPFSNRHYKRGWVKTSVLIMVFTIWSWFGFYNSPSLQPVTSNHVFLEVNLSELGIWGDPPTNSSHCFSWYLQTNGMWTDWLLWYENSKGIKKTGLFPLSFLPCSFTVVRLHIFSSLGGENVSFSYSKEKLENLKKAILPWTVTFFNS